MALTAGLRWAGLVALSAAGVLLLEALHLPAALLIGPMVAGVVLAARGIEIKVPPLLFLLARGVVGAMIATAIKPSILGEIAADWPIFAAGVFSVLAASTGLGLLLARGRVLPGTTAVWGSTPGAATATVLMAEAFGADARLVAFMQYLRVALVAGAAAIVARLAAVEGTAPPGPDWLAPLDFATLGPTLALILLGAIAGQRLRLPAGPFLLPMVAGAVLQGFDVMTIAIPPLLLALSYAVIGWGIGLSFTRAILGHALRVLPRVLLSILSLMAICGGFAGILMLVAGVDPLTAYLAMSPGGADTVAIIAASAHVDAPFVMAMQMARFLVVLALGPALARFVSNRAGLRAE
ncbi:AbrB family transcriptional regulator [Zavarzinia sp.]|uniref:AbrB family transcriptional regulator n=1 Tax=Zavarzinia sp. TaxID=2027920 RepID=UPI0035683ECF